MSRPLRGVSRLILIQAAVLLVLVGIPAAVQGAGVENGGPPKPAWKWSVDERLAARFDPEAMAAREAERQAKETELRKSWADPLSEEKARTTEAPSVQEVIYGSKTPELFLPVELFGMLLESGFLPKEGGEHLQQSRGWIEERAAALGFGRDFWDRLEETATPYLKLLRKEDRQHPVIQAEDYGEDRTRLCRARAHALEAAQTEFGEESFLHLLYEAVAPNAAIARLLGPRPPDYKRYAEELLFQERGCQ
jgi:hypothetical protein